MATIVAKLISFWSEKLQMSDQQIPGTFPVPQLSCTPQEIENSLGKFISYWTQCQKLLPRLSLPALSFLDAAVFKLYEIPVYFLAPRKKFNMDTIA